MKINESLICLQEEWKDKVMNPFLEEYSTEIFSDLFSYGISDGNNTKSKSVMIIGQEANNFINMGESLEDIQRWCIYYYQKQVIGMDNEGYEGIKSNSSPFWNFYKELHNKGIKTSWNNLDKLHRMISDQTSSLNASQEVYLHKPFGIENKSLLQYEIEAAKPDLIIFMTGPYYWASMTASFGLRSDALDRVKPSHAKLCQRIENILGLSIPVIWTYHPSHLNRQHGGFDLCIEEIVTAL